MQSLAIISDSEEGVEGGAAPGPPGAAKDLDHMDLASRCCPLYVTEKEGAKKMASQQNQQTCFPHPPFQHPSKRCGSGHINAFVS